VPGLCVDSAAMHMPSVVRLLLMLFASARVLPTDPLLATRSLPARSTTVNTPRVIGGGGCMETASFERL